MDICIHGKIESKTTSWSKYTPTLGQYSNGVRFPNTSSGFNWTDSSTTSGTANFSISFSGKLFNVAIGIQPGMVTPERTGYFITCPYKNVNVKLYASRTYYVTQYAVYRYNKYSGSNTAVFDHYEYIKVANGIR